MGSFGFRPLARSDFALLSQWLAQPHVARWWAGYTHTRIAPKARQARR